MFPGFDIDAEDGEGIPQWNPAGCVPTVTANRAESETLWVLTPTFVMFHHPAAVIRCEDPSDGCCLGCGLCWE